MNDELKPVIEGIFEQGPPPRLLGAICPECKKKFFPKPIVCPDCLKDVQDIKLSPNAKIYTYSVLRTRPPYGLPQPYAGGYVDLDGENLRIYTLFDPEKIEALDFGKKVTLKVGELGVDNEGKPCSRYYFTTDDGGNQ